MSKVDIESLAARQSSKALMELSNAWDISAKSIGMMRQKTLMVEQQEAVGECEYLARQGQQGFVIARNKHPCAWGSGWRVQARASSSQGRP